MKGAVIYISSSREKPEFENKIIKDMMEKKGDLPVYSVTQKGGPGINKCVGTDIGVSGFNFCRQLQMVIEMVKEDYVISCEADCLYSPDYFTWVPPTLDIYRNSNNYVIPYHKDYFLNKFSQTAFQVAGRDVYLKRLNFILAGQPQWNTKMRNFPKEIGLELLDHEREQKMFKTEFGCFQFKTGDGMRPYTSSDNKRIWELPYWGTAKALRKEYVCE
jgi:hypothetical protein